MDPSEIFNAKIKMELGELIFRVLGLQVQAEQRDAQIAALTARLAELDPPKGDEA